MTFPDFELPVTKVKFHPDGPLGPKRGVRFCFLGVAFRGGVISRWVEFHDMFWYFCFLLVTFTILQGHFIGNFMFLFFMILIVLGWWPEHF